MRLFELELDEDQIRSLVKSIVDQYERSFHSYGNYQDAVSATQEVTLQNLEDNAEAVEELIEHQGTMH